MKITQNTRERLIIQDFPWVIGLLFAALGGGLVYAGIRSALSQGFANVQFVMFTLIGTLFFLAQGLFFNRSVFVFDLVQQQLNWSRTGLFGRKAGTLPLGRITGCVVQTMQSDREAPTYRLVLASPEGDIPLTFAYSTGSAIKRMEMREAIHTALGLAAPEAEPSLDVDGMIKSLVVAGQPIQAIKLLREHRGIGLAEAKSIVDAMK